MENWIWAIPAVLMVLTVGIRVWKTCRYGLFLALLQLAATAASAAAAFGLTRLFVNPATVDIMDLGAALWKALPEEVALLGSWVEAFIRALPTALVALVVFTVAFALLRFIVWRVIRSLNKKYGWSEKVLAFQGNRLVALIPGMGSAVICLLAELVLLNGLLCVASNVLTATQAFTDAPEVKKAAVIVQELANSPAIALADDMGCRWAFCELTTGQRDGKSFSVGEEMIGLAKTTAALDELSVFLPGSDQKPDGDDFRALPEYLEKNPEVLGTAMNMLDSYREKLLEGDAVNAISQAIQVTPEQVKEYLSKLETVTVQEDIATVCNIAAILADRGLWPENMEQWDTEALADPELQRLIKEELLKNEALSALFGFSAS